MGSTVAVMYARFRRRGGSGWTGSAAGYVAAYLLRHGRAASGQPLLLQQGRYAGRPVMSRSAGP